jgi:sigma-B regulation protein RsbU (phosphoserine phosphatase)
MATPEKLVQPIPVEKAPSKIWEAEKDEARRIQESLLPTGSLRGPSFEVACRFSPFSEVSGDFADYFDLPNGLVGIYLGDVVGKGLPAAMYGAMVMGTLRGTNKTGQNTGSVLSALNRHLLVRPVSGRYCATIYALFNPVTLELKFSNAGLPLPLHASEEGCKAVGDGGLPSGLVPGSSYDVHSIKLSPGDSVLLATDGLHEIRNGKDEDFSWEKLSKVWHECRGSSAKETLDFLFEGMKEFSAGGPQHDDITVVVVKVMSTMVLPNPAGGFRRVPLR